MQSLDLVAENQLSASAPRTAYGETHRGAQSPATLKRISGASGLIMVAVYTLARPIQIPTPRRLAVLITLVADENKRLVKGRDDALLAFPSFSAVDDATADITLGRFDHCLFAPMLMIAPFARASKPPAIRPSPDLQLHADPGGDVAPEPPYDPVDDFRRSRSCSGARLLSLGEFTYASVAYRGYGISRQISGNYTMKEIAADVLEAADKLGWNEFT